MQLHYNRPFPYSEESKGSWKPAITTYLILTPSWFSCFANLCVTLLISEKSSCTERLCPGCYCSFHKPPVRHSLEQHDSVTNSASLYQIGSWSWVNTHNFLWIAPSTRSGIVSLDLKSTNVPDMPRCVHHRRLQWAFNLITNMPQVTSSCDL